jgi:hypothetical protein
MKRLYLKLYVPIERSNYYSFWESSFPNMNEDVTTMQKAGTKMIELITSCRRDHRTAAYDKTVISANVKILALM